MGQGLHRIAIHVSRELNGLHSQLKKDYIPGHGDSLDMVLLGASWDKDRARELRGIHIH
jgi:hypothetical protein